MGKSGIVLGVSLVVFGVVIQTQTRGPTIDGRQHLVSMSESAEAMRQAGEVMLDHGEWMLSDGRRSNDQSLIDRGQHWLQDGEALIQEASWMAMDPVAVGSLLTSPGDLKDDGNWGMFSRTATQMLHDPKPRPQD